MEPERAAGIYLREIAGAASARRPCQLGDEQGGVGPSGTPPLQAGLRDRARARDGSTFIGPNGPALSPPSPRGRGRLFVVSDISRRLTVFDQNDMETPRPVRTKLNVLLDIGRPRWTGDEIDGPR